MWRSVIGDDRRDGVKVAEIQSATALLLDIEVVGFPAQGGSGHLTDFILAFDVRGNPAALARDIFCSVECELRHLIGDRLALCLIGFKDVRCSLTIEHGG